MPGKHIDRFVFTVLGAAGSYLFFLNIGGSIPLACLWAFLLCITVRGLFLQRPPRFRCTAATAAAELLRIAAMDEAEARDTLRRLIEKKYPHESFRLVPLLKHPSSTVSTGEVFSLWKKYRDAQHLLLAATCTVDPRTVMYARELDAPKVALIDRRQLLRLIRLSGVPDKTIAEPLFSRLKRIPRNLTFRHTGVKNALFGLALTGLYFLTGRALYLFSGLFSLFVFGCGIPSGRCRKRLFL